MLAWGRPGRGKNLTYRERQQILHIFWFLVEDRRLKNLTKSVKATDVFTHLRQHHNFPYSYDVVSRWFKRRHSKPSVQTKVSFLKVAT